MKWFLQKKGWELGNFIMATPALKYLADRDNSVIPVFFNSSSISELYKNCPFITVLDSIPPNKPFATSECPPKHRDESDYQAWCRVLLGQKIQNVSLPYMDLDVTFSLNRIDNKKHIALFCGCASGHLSDRKKIPSHILQFMVSEVINAGFVPVVLGNKGDYNRFWCKVDVSQSISFLKVLSLRDSVSVLEQCDAFISNDTGLYHVAGALNKPGLVFWISTKMNKNKSPCNRINHIHNPKSKPKLFRREIYKFLQTLK